MALELFIPSDPDEQTAIATILSDMDAAIAALEAKLAKARQVKQGMMQDLLTGNIASFTREVRAEQAQSERRTQERVIKLFTDEAI